MVTGLDLKWPELLSHGAQRGCEGKSQTESYPKVIVPAAARLAFEVLKHKDDLSPPAELAWPQTMTSSSPLLPVEPTKCLGRMLETGSFEVDRDSLKWGNTLPPPSLAPLPQL